MTSLSLISLGKSFGDVTAVADVSFDVAQGEFLVLLGPSGCGKTTTLRMIAGFIEATSGAIRIGQSEVTREPPYRRNIGFVFQNYALFPHLSVHDNIAFGLRRRKVQPNDIETRVERALALVKLDGLGARMPRALSGGQQQRVAIARALVIEPDVLLLDEPLSNLDAKLRIDVRQELKRLQTSLGLTTIMVTHDQDEAMSIGDRLVVMNHGRVQQIGSPSDLYRRPLNRFVAGFVGRGNFLEGSADPGAGRFTTRSGLGVACRNLSTSHDLLLVRPESIGVARGSEAGPNRFPALIEAATFLGSVYELDLRLPSGELLSATAPAATAANGADWAVGDHISATIDPNAAIGLAASDTRTTV